MKKILSKMDILLMFLLILFIGFGLLMIFSSSSIAAVLRYKTTSSYFFIKQLKVVILGLLVSFFIILRFPTSKYRYFSTIGIIGIIVALIGLFTYGIISNGAQSWYNLGSFNFQPAELAKPLIVIFYGVYYNKLSKAKNQNMLLYLVPLLISGVIAVLVARQPDFGGAVIICFISFMLYLAVPIPKEYKKKINLLLFSGVIVLGLSILLFGGNILNETQLKRFTFQNPCSRYTEDTGYQVCNGFIAINNGKLFGVGLGNSTQKYLYLPEAHTDFIYAIIVEELGLIAGILVLVAYMVLLFRLLKISKNCYNLRNSIIVYGTFLIILAHVMVNLLGLAGLIPLTGVPLPFLSYGGSFNIILIAMIFIVERIVIENNITKTHNEIKNL